jgi:hypothetical protein
MRYYSKGSIIADSREEAKMLMVITSGQVTRNVVNIIRRSKGVQFGSWLESTSVKSAILNSFNFFETLI